MRLIMGDSANPRAWGRVVPDMTTSTFLTKSEFFRAAKFTGNLILPAA